MGKDEKEKKRKLEKKVIQGNFPFYRESLPRNNQKEELDAEFLKRLDLSFILSAGKEGEEEQEGKIGSRL